MHISVNIEGGVSMNNSVKIVGGVSMHNSVKTVNGVSILYLCILSIKSLHIV